MSNLALIVNAALAALVLIGYIVLTALGDDGSPLLALLAGQGIAAVAGKATDAVKSANAAGKP